MMWGSSPSALANRFNTLAQNWVADGPAARAERARRKLMSIIGSKEPATLNEVANAVGRGAPAVSRAVDALVRAGLVERTQDPNNRRRLALRLSEQGEASLRARPAAHGKLATVLDRLAQSELRAIERAIEIL